MTDLNNYFMGSRCDVLKNSRRFNEQINIANGCQIEIGERKKENEKEVETLPPIPFPD